MHGNTESRRRLNSETSVNDDQFYIERRDDGDYALRRGWAKRASAIEGTQAEAIKRARRMDPGTPIHVERVRNTGVSARDKWRKP
jgi:hypothetical protein